jgi:tetratricopeptide (TPR) repeat protein
MRARFFVLFVFVAVAALGNAVQAQTRVNNSGNGGINIIRGQIFTPGERRADGQVTVRLQNFSNGELSLITDQSGGFEFRSLSAGSYTLVVEAGDAFETFRESVTIDPDAQVRDPTIRILVRRPKIYTVPVYLQFKRVSSEKPGVVDAKLAAVPKGALDHYQKGLEMVRSGRTDAALEEFRLAIAEYQPFAEAYLQIGTIYLKAGQLDEAVDALRSAVSYDRNDFDAAVDYGIALYGKKDLSAAEDELTRASRLNATAVTPHYYLGLLYIQARKLDKAQEELETAKRLKGTRNLPLLHRYLGGVYLERHMNKEAAAELETYISLAPDTKDADRIRQTIADLKAKTD